VSNHEAEMRKQLGGVRLHSGHSFRRTRVDDYLDLIKLNGTLTLVGASPTPFLVAVGSPMFRRRQIAASAIGGIGETQEM
ncbi:MAG: NAD(P)-dependent alcohol dehydrogenase, partial [Terriglobales bacterium]